MTHPLVFVGDIHLGRRPTGIEAVLTQLDLDAHTLGPAAAWSRTVTAAIAAEARAVILAGDVVDDARDRFEAYGQLERGARALVDAGVPVFAVAGNHDTLVLPKLVERIPGVHLLGAKGHWERVPLTGPGPLVDLLGWSFPTEKVRNDPLDDPTFASAVAARRPGAALVGVLHADLDRARSPYAPVARSRLERTEVDAWFLGHIHRPDALDAPRPIGYLGSLVGLDVGEAGHRGPWIVRAAPGDVEATPFGPPPVMRWERLDVRLRADTPDLDAVHAQLERAVHAHVERALTTTPAAPVDGPRLIVLRATLRGRLAHPEIAAAYADRHSAVDAIFHVRGVPCAVTHVANRATPAIDLELLRNEPTPVGRIAERFLALERGDATDLREGAEARVRPLLDGGWALDPERHPPPDLDEALLAAAWRALGRLLAQRTSGEGG